MIKFFITLILCCLCLTTFAGEIHNLRGKRYCEILLAKNSFSSKIHVYNTIGLNDCPAPIWNAIKPEDIKRQTGNKFVHLNGPRYWVIDGMQNSNLINPTVKTFGNLAVREAGILNMNLDLRLSSSKPYTKHSVIRQTTWLYEAGKPIYEIRNSHGKVFIMQSYSIQKIHQSEDTLPSLSKKLNLPRGWSFHTRTLKQNSYLTPRNNVAVVIHDEYLNTYQQEIGTFE